MEVPKVIKITISDMIKENTFWCYLAGNDKTFIWVQFFYYYNN